MLHAFSVFHGKLLNIQECHKNPNSGFLAMLEKNDLEKKETFFDLNCPINKINTI